MTTKILLVDDEINLVDPLAYSLKEKGYDVVTAYSGDEALSMYEREEPDLILLDWSMPEGKSGLEVLQEVRTAQNFVPVIMVTGKSAKDEVVEGLENGADDYITKPFNLNELFARVKSALRRSEQSTVAKPKRLRFGDIVVDLLSHRVWLKDKEVSLSPREFSMLKLFIENPKRIYSRDDLIEKVWGLDFEGDTKTVDVHICWLRQKLERDANHPKVIQTVRGFGYKLGS
jgi:DNA-binding response OmpR family regulator